MKSLPQRDNLLEKKFLEKLTSICDRMVRKNFKNPSVLCALQVASLDFLGSVVMANSKILSDQSGTKEASTSLKLDYIEHVRALADAMFDEIKKQVRSVELH
jgi:hypothetical protein